MRTLFILLAALALLVVAPSAAFAQSEADKTTARSLGIEGQEALEKKDFKTAADKFSRAEKLYHAPTLLVGLGRAYVGLGKYVEAMETFNGVIREKVPENAPEAFLAAQEDARREVEGLDQKIAWVTITVSGPSEPVVTLDGAAVSVASLGVKRAVNPGEHDIKVSADGYKAASQLLSIASGDAKDVAITLEVDPTGTAEPVPGVPGGDTGGDGDDGGSSIMPIIGWTCIGVGGAALILGGVMGGLAMGKHSKLEENCPNGACGADQQDNIDSFHTFGTVSTIGFIAGGVLAAGGVVLLIVAPSGEAEAGDASLELGPGHAKATLRF